SHRRYRTFVNDYRQGRFEESQSRTGASGEAGRRRRREYIRDYVRWLRPHRGAIAVVLVLAFVAAGLQLVEPLFMRFIVDRVLLESGLDTAARLQRLHTAGAVFLTVIPVSNLVGALLHYPQRQV